MKKLLILSLLISTKVLAITNPAVPGSTYDGTSDIAVFKMLIFSCFQNCNAKYFESLYVAEISPERIPDKGHTPGIFMPDGIPLESIRQLQDPEVPKHYQYPNLKDGEKVIQFQSNFRKTPEGYQTTLRFAATLINGSYYLLRPVYIKTESEQAAPSNGDKPSN